MSDPTFPPRFTLNSAMRFGEPALGAVVADDEAFEIPQHYLHLMVEHAPAALAMLDRKLRYITANRMWIQELGLENTTIVGRSHYEIFPQLHPSWRSIYEGCLQGRGRVQKVETLGPAKPDGTRDTLSWEIRPWRFNDQEMGGLVIHFSKSTPRVAGKIDPMDGVTSAFDRVPVPLWEIDEEGRVISANHAAMELRDGKPLPERTYLWDAWREWGLARVWMEPWLKDFDETPDAEVREAHDGVSWLWMKLASDGVRRLMAMALPPHWEIVKLDDPDNSGATLDDKKDHELEALRQKVEELKREVDTQGGRLDRIQDTLAHLPFGVVVLNDRQESIYANPQAALLRGTFLPPDQTFEDWLRSAYEDPLMAEEQVGAFREKVWAKCLPHILSIPNAHSLWKDIEIRPIRIQDEDMLLILTDVTESRLFENTLRSSEARYRSLFEDSSIPMVMIDPSGRVHDTNAAAEPLFRKSRYELRGKSLDLFFDASDRGVWHRAMEPTPATQRSGEFVVRLNTAAHGGSLWVRASLLRLRPGRGNPVLTACFFQDITSWKENERALTENNALQRAMLDSISDTILVVDHSGTIQQAAGAGCLDFANGANFSTFLGKADDWVNLCEKARINALEQHLNWKTGFRENYGKIRVIWLGDETYVVVLRADPELPSFRLGLQAKSMAFDMAPEPSFLLERSGRVLAMNRSALRDYSEATTVYDIYEPDSANRILTLLREPGLQEGLRLSGVHFNGAGDPLTSWDVFGSVEGQEKTSPVLVVHRVRASVLASKMGDKDQDTPAKWQALLDRKEAHIREAHHRIKNNLQIIASLLTLEEGTTDDPHARESLLAAQNRISAVAKLHQQLYRPQAEGTIHLKEYLEDISASLVQALQLQRRRLVLVTECAPLMISQDRAIHVALLVNELVTNAVKHAFPGGRGGRITIRVTEKDKGFLLEVEDDGVGSRKTVGHSSSDSGLGSHLLEVLARELNGKPVIDTSNGMRVSLFVPLISDHNTTGEGVGT